MTKRKGSVTAAELDAKLQSDPVFVARRRADEQRRAEQSARLHAEEEPILADLRNVGWNVQSVWELVNSKTNYETALPVLLKHLPLSYSDRTREGIARALAVPQAAFAWPRLVDEYRRAPAVQTDGLRLGLKDGLAVALSVIAKHSPSRIEELSKLAKDRSNGSSRLLLLAALKESDNPVARQTLEELKNDPELASEISAWKRR